MTHRVALLLGCLCLVAVRGQVALSDEQKIYYSHMAYDDANFLQVLIDLGVDEAQATRWAALLEGLNSSLKVIDAKLAAQSRDPKALRELAVLREALLTGKSLAAPLPAAAAYEDAVKVAAEAREVAYQATYGRVVSSLTPDQRTRLVEPQVQDEAQAEADMTRRQQQEQQRRQDLFGRIGRLMGDVRNRILDIREFEQRVPKIALDAATTYTAQTDDQPLVKQLAAMIQEALTRTYRMNPVEFQQVGPDLATELVDAVDYVVSQAATPAANAPKGPNVAPSRVLRAVRYARAITLLHEWAKPRRNPMSGRRSEGAAGGPR